MRLKGVKKVTVRKGGKVYVYYRHRKAGVVLKSEHGTAAFVREIDLIEQRLKSSQPKDGSLGALIRDYKSSPEHAKLADRTKADYVRVFDWFRAVDDIGVLEIDSALVYEFRDKALKQHGRRFANYVVQVLRLTLSWALQRDRVKRNAAAKVVLLERPKSLPRANRAWTDDERETVLNAAPLELRKVIAIGMFTGLREGDAVRLLKDTYDGQTIKTVTRKTHEPLEAPVHFRLRQILALMPEPPKKPRKLEPFALTLAVNRWGKSWTESGFRASFFKLTRKLEDAGKVGPGLTFHGLRHTVGKLVIEAGGSVQDVAAILGQRSEAMAKHYSREADNRQRMKGVVRKMERIERKKMDKRTD